MSRLRRQTYHRRHGYKAVSIRTTVFERPLLDWSPHYVPSNTKKPTATAALISRYHLEATGSDGGQADVWSDHISGRSYGPYNPLSRYDEEAPNAETRPKIMARFEENQV